MFLDNNKKVICLSVPKTGSTSCSTFFRENIPYAHKFYGKIMHTTIDELCYKNIVLHPIQEYRIFGIIRDPVQRFLSAVNDMIGMKSPILQHSYTNKKELLILVKNILFKEYDKFYNEQTTIFLPQTHWLKIEGIKIYRYENLNNFVSEICEIYDIDFNKFNVFERRKVGVIPVSADDLDPETRNKILELYAEDQEIYDKTPIINS